MPEGFITTGTNPNVLATIVAALALPRLKAATAMYAISDPSYGRDVAQYGQSVNVPIPAEYSSNLLADGGTITRQNPVLGNATITLNRHREISFEITDLNEALARPDLRQTNLGQALANMAQDIDSDLLSIYTQFTATAVGAYNTAITEATVDSAETTLFNQRVPMGMRKSLVVSGNGYSQIRQIPRFTEDRMIREGAGPIADGYVGRLKDLDVYRDQLVLVTSSTSTHGVALAPPALLTAVRPLGATGNGMGVIQVELSEDNIGIRLTMSYHHEVLGTLMSIDVLYGYVAGRTAFGVEVKH